MTTLEFQYLYGKPEIGRAITQAVGAVTTCWDGPGGDFDVEKALAIATETTAEVRRLVTFELSRLLDSSGVAREWNDAVENAIRTVEEMP